MLYSRYFEEYRYHYTPWYIFSPLIHIKTISDSCESDDDDDDIDPDYCPSESADSDYSEGEDDGDLSSNEVPVEEHGASPSGFDWAIVGLLPLLSLFKYVNFCSISHNFLQTSLLQIDQ